MYLIRRFGQAEEKKLLLFIIKGERLLLAALYAFD